MTIIDRTRLSVGFGAQRYYIFWGLVFLYVKLLIKEVEMAWMQEKQARFIQQGCLSNILYFCDSFVAKPT
jgi:hypothetical protein